MGEELHICSLSKEFYLELLVETNKTPLEDDTENSKSLLKKTTDIFTEAPKYIFALIESWFDDSLRENEKTSPDNETSVVIRGIVDNKGFLLCGDAGIRALNKAMDYLETNGEDIKDKVDFYQIPHHGGRHNISPSLLDRMLGHIVEEGETINKSAFASVAKNSDHPLRMVTNAYIRRGVNLGWRTSYWHHWLYHLLFMFMYS